MTMATTDDRQMFRGTLSRAERRVQLASVRAILSDRKRGAGIPPMDVRQLRAIADAARDRAAARMACHD